MPKANEIQAQLMSIFQSELEEHLGTLNRGFLTLEQGVKPEKRDSLLGDLFRAAHSLKGAARAVSLREIEGLSHQLEDALSIIRQEDKELTPQHFDVLLAMVDMIRNTMAAYQHGEQIQPESLAALQNRLQNVMGGKLEPLPDLISTETFITSGQVTPTPPPVSRATNSAPAELPQPPIVNQPDVPSHNRSLARDDTIRVATAKLDTLMDNLGELLVARMRTEQALEQLQTINQNIINWQKTWRKVRPYYQRLQRQHKSVVGMDFSPLLDFLKENEADLKSLNGELNILMSRLKNDRSHLHLVIDSLENGIRNARMLPIATLFDVFPRMVRDLARERDKEIVLTLEGAETEVDRQVLELMKDPLTHLLRNAVDHGIEPPDRREISGKSRKGLIRLRAEQRGNNLVLEVRDDGQGMDLQALRLKAVESGLISSAEAAGLNEPETLELIFRPGFSTADKVTDISGRGIGMDVVRKNLEKLHGLIQVDTEAGQGTTFTLTLPLTFATSQVLLVSAAGGTFALPMVNVERILRVDIKQVGSVDGRPAIYANNRLLPLYSLAQVLKLPDAEKPLPPDAKIPIVVVGVVEKHAALRVDGFLNTREVVIKDLGRQIRRVRNVAGATVLGDGQIIIVLNMVDLIKSIQSAALAPAGLPLAPRDIRKRKVLVVDDSITTRTLEKSILENAGYTVMVAADGREAWDLIRGNEDELPDLVVSDVSMPNMDGFALTESIKGESRTAQLPVVLVTSLDSQQDKIRGMEVGADAYVVKSSFDQRELLEIIEQLIG